MNSLRFYNVYNCFPSKYQALTLLDYCLHGGSEQVVVYAKTNLYVVKTLTEFQYIDEDGKDQGANGMLQ